RDERWERGVLAESRQSQGEAVTRGRQILARDKLDDRALRDACDAEMDRVRRAIEPFRDARVRGVVTATPLGLEATISITIAGVSVVTSPDRAAADYQMLKSLLRPSGTARPSAAQIVWRNGSAAVLL